MASSANTVREGRYDGVRGEREGEGKMRGEDEWGRVSMGRGV